MVPWRPLLVRQPHLSPHGQHPSALPQPRPRLLCQWTCAPSLAWTQTSCAMKTAMTSCRPLSSPVWKLRCGHRCGCGQRCKRSLISQRHRRVVHAEAAASFSNVVHVAVPELHSSFELVGFAWQFAQTT